MHQLEPERDPQGDGKGPAVTDQVTFQCLQARWQQRVRWTVELVGRTGSRMARGASPNSLKLSPRVCRMETPAPTEALLSPLRKDFRNPEQDLDNGQLLF